MVMAPDYLIKVLGASFSQFGPSVGVNVNFSYKAPPLDSEVKNKDLIMCLMV